MPVTGIAVKINSCAIPVIIEVAALYSVRRKVRVKQSNTFATIMACAWIDETIRTCGLQLRCEHLTNSVAIWIKRLQLISIGLAQIM